jgi:hypothetical protein
MVRYQVNTAGALMSSVGYAQKGFVSSLHCVGLRCRHEPLISFRLDAAHSEKIYQSMVASFDPTPRRCERLPCWQDSHNVSPIRIP